MTLVFAQANISFFSPQRVQRFNRTSFPTTENVRNFKSVYGFRYDGDTSEIERELAVDRLRKLSDELRGFVNDTGFDRARFDLQLEDLRKEMFEVMNAVNRGGTPDIFLQSLLFTHHMFQIMSESTMILQIYSDLDQPIHKAMSEVVEIGLRALVLNNWQGALDLGIPNYLSKILRLYHWLNVWAGKFGNIQGVPWITRHFFKNRVIQVGITLEDLRSRLPQEMNHHNVSGLGTEEAKYRCDFGIVSLDIFT